MTTKTSVFQQLKQKISSKKPKKSAYSLVESEHFMFLCAEAAFKILRSQKGKENLCVALSDETILSDSELFSDIGFKFKEGHVYLTSDQTEGFDLIIGPEGFDLTHFVSCVRAALQNIKYYNFRTCLNIHKLATIAVLTYLAPNESSVVEVGSYKCGTTIFMAELAHIMQKKIKIFALDTFEGMPAATDPDRKSATVYDTGMFIDNPLEDIQEKIRDQNVSSYIELVKGDVEVTLKTLEASNIAFMFLDTDQYRGTKMGLDYAQKLENSPHIIIDDTSLKGVSQAIDEFIADKPSYKRHSIYTNFDYLYSQ